MRLGIEAILDYTIADEADVLLQLEVAPGLDDQRVIEGRMTVSTGNELHPQPVDEGIGRRTWTRGAGKFRAEYRATVEVTRAAPDIAGLPAAAHFEMPPEVIPYIWPSRYCQSDQFERFVAKRFPETGGDKVLAMAEWIHSHLDYVMGSSDATTTATDTLVAREGICRDYAHLMISFARAAGIPARMVSAYAWQLDPPDFHAVVEVWLDGGWRLVDPTRLAPVEGLARIVVGRDATDIAFMTVFGSAELNEQSVKVERVDD